MYKVKVKIYGTWADFEEVYGSGIVAKYPTREDAERAASEMRHIYGNQYKVVKV